MSRFNRKQIEALGFKILPDNKGVVKLTDGKVEIEKFKPYYIEGKGVFVPHNVISSKNSKQLFTKSFIKDGQSRTIAGSTEQKAVKEYRRCAGQYYSILSSHFRQELIGHKKPYYIEFFFVRETLRTFDFANMIQLVQDMMTEFNWIDDDDVDNMVPVPPPKGSPIFIVNKFSPGVWIKIV